MMLSIFLFTCWPFLYHFWRNVFKSCANFLIELLFFLLLCCESSLYILNTNLLLDMWFVNIFSHSVVYFIFLTFHPAYFPASPPCTFLYVLLTLVLSSSYPWCRLSLVVHSHCKMGFFSQRTYRSSFLKNL